MKIQVLTQNNSMKYFFFLIFLQTNYLFAQKEIEPEGLTLCNIVVKEYFTPIKQSGSSSPFGINYRGTLKKGIRDAWNVPLTRIKFNREPPLKYVSFEAQSGNTPNAARLLVQQNLELHFGFKITDSIDSIEIWTINKIDTTKLTPFFPEKHSTEGSMWGWGECIYDDSWEGIGAPISELAKECERVSNHITVFNEENNGLYYFDIPYNEMKSFDALSQFLKKYYGLGLTKGKTLMPVKYVTFK
jgi:hypothetical protein